MTSKEIRQKYLEFFRTKGHAIIPSASIMPENDPTTLFTSSGMQPLVPYLLGEKHPSGTRLVNSQKSFRAEDIEEVGDNRHTTFFEMLGNWSLGNPAKPDGSGAGYFKKEQLPWFFELLTKELGLDPKNLYVSVFRGNEEIGIAKDTEAIGLWKEMFKSAGIEAKEIDYESMKEAEEGGLGEGRIFCYVEKKNWWSRSGVPANMPVGEPGGPDSELFIDLGADLKKHENSAWANLECHINCDCGRFIELGNSVFMEFIRTENGFEKLKQQNVDFGGGLERIVMAVQGKDNIFETDLFINILNKISELSGGKKYKENFREFEVIADHMRAATFIMADDRGISPLNTGQGYIVRRLLRRALRYGRMLGINKNGWQADISEIIIKEYGDIYPELERNIDFIIKNIKEEQAKFEKTLERGLNVLNKKIEAQVKKVGESCQAQGVSLVQGPNNIQIWDDVPHIITGKWLFDFYQTLGFPPELVIEELKTRNYPFTDLDIEMLYKKFNEEMAKHQELSRTASAGMFKGGLADASVETTKLHSAAHFLLAALRKVLGEHVVQKGSNITAERLRFDFSHSEKMTVDQIKQVENLVNNEILKKCTVSMDEMSLDEAKAAGAMGVFESKYGEKVKVYTMGDFSKEICGGPHVENTGSLGVFKIIKEESSSAGVRRIKAVLG